MAAGFRTLADQLRGWPDERLSRLLSERPDLATPAPHDSGQLASRVATRSSLWRALDRLSHLELALLGTLAAQGPVSRERLLADVDADSSVVVPALDRILDLALAWESTKGLRVLNGVAEGLARGPALSRPATEVPELAVAVRAPEQVDGVAAGAAFETVRRVELLIDLWSADPPRALRSGGLGVRPLRATALALQTDPAVVALLVETAHASALVTTAADGDGNPVWLPTDLADQWVLRPPAERWVGLVHTWLRSARMPGLVGGRDPAGKVWNALAPELVGSHMAESRATTLAALAALPPGTGLAADNGLEPLLALLHWQRPRRPRTRDDQVAWTVTEASALGVTGLGGLASYMRPLLTGDHDRAQALLEGLLPDPVDHVLIQADLTAVAPGPLASQLARRLQLVADVESRGGATVYRFSSASVRRALDSGWTAGEVHEFLGSVSRTPLPQPLTYLVDDTARTFGTVRVGAADAFLRSDDEAALTELLHHPKAASLGLRRLAPTVVVSTTPADVLLPRLRELGLAPVVEAPDGTVHVARPDARRGRTPREPGTRYVAPPVQVARVVRAIRAGDEANDAAPLPGLALTPSGSLAALREAAEAGDPVLISYVDTHGTRSQRVVDPVSVEGGVLTARDRRTEDVRTFAVHRITTVAPIETS